jgi:alkanesulfonate monooxygenase SsuD/methylene tetrahydromethanopterin reductase-like flavin-dependent oxidoreductase (luciferase family)
MEIGLGLDASLRLTFDDQAQLSKEAARLGYESLWTPDGAGEDGFQVCSWRWAASREVVPEGLKTGIAVSPVGLRTAMGFAMSAGTVSKLTGGRFILGVGAGAAYTPPYRRTFGLRERSSLKLMRDYVTSVRGLVNGEMVTCEGRAVTLRGVRLAIDPPPRTPVYLGALGPEMLRLGGEIADGIALNWCSPEQIAWSRDRIEEGAARSGRDPAEVGVEEYIRVCVDDDLDTARRAFTRAVMGYALGRPGAAPRERSMGYRAHFERMGFTEALARLDEMREKGAPQTELVEAFPADLLKRVGYYGPAAGAAQAFRRLAEGLDIAVVRVVAARPGIESVRAVMEACRPELARP